MKKIFGIVAAFVAVAILFAGSVSMAEAGGGSYCSTQHDYPSAAWILVEGRDCGGGVMDMAFAFTGSDIDTMFAYGEGAGRELGFSLNPQWVGGIEVGFVLHSPCQWQWETADVQCKVRDDLILQRIISAMVESDSNVVFTGIARASRGAPCRTDGYCVERYQGEYVGVAAYSVQIEVVGASWTP